ncbi:MAG: M50 family metallopeptidase [Patescibacteria group bacterium]
MEAIITNPGIQLLALLCATLGLSYAANYFLARVFVGRTYRYLIAPGVIVHEYSHALACIVTGARIRKVRVFAEEGGYVEHEPARLPLGEGIITVAPILGAAIAVYLLAVLLVPGFVGLGELQVSSWQFLAFAYLASSITAAMAPSAQDLRVGLAAFVVLCTIIGLGALVPMVADYFDLLLGTEFVRIRGLVLFSLIVLATLVAAAGAAFGALQRTTRQGMTYSTGAAGSSSHGPPRGSSAKPRKRPRRLSRKPSGKGGGGLFE